MAEDVRREPRPGRKLLRRGQRRRPDDEGRMPLVEHLRELRSRLLKAVAAVIPGAVLGAIFYEEIASFLVRPVCEATTPVTVGAGPTQCGPLTVTGLISPFTIALTISVGTGLLIAAPVILYQLWAFVTPGLHRNERRWSMAFVVTSVPLFFAGAALCYLVMPNAVGVLLGFTIAEAANIVPLNEYLNILVRLILVFGLGFDIPVFLVLLNAVGVLRAQTLRNSWRWIVLGSFLFAAIASPTGDPFTMLALAVPMILLFGAAYLFAAWNDRRRARRSAEPDYADLGDDEISPLDTRPSRLDDLD